MDEVEVLRVQPVVLDVVNHEAHVGGYPGGLDGAEVDAEDFSAGELVGDCEMVSCVLIMIGEVDVR